MVQSTDAMRRPKRFITLEDALRAVIADSDAHPVRLERRPKRWMFGALNYGEIPTLMNAADRCAWDVFAPGYGRSLAVEPSYTIERVLGVLRLANDNHKIAVKLRGVDGFDDARAADEIRRYSREYTRRMRLDGMYAPLDHIEALTPAASHHQPQSPPGGTTRGR